MSEIDREHLITNIVAHAGDGVTPEVQQRVVGYWSNVDPELGAKVAAGLGRGNGANGAGGPLSAGAGAAEGAHA
jgi:catalase